MNMPKKAPSDKNHLQLLTGQGEGTDDPKQRDRRRDRIRIATVFVDQKDRQKWIKTHILEFWHTYQDLMTEVLLDKGPKWQELLTTVRAVQASFLQSIDIKSSSDLNELLDTLFVVAHGCYHHLGSQTSGMRAKDYDQVHTSSDFFNLTPDAQAMQLKTRHDLAAVIQKKDFELDTSSFEKELIEGVLAALSFRIAKHKHIITREQLYRYLQSIFTLFNQQKLIHQSQK